MNEMVKIEQCTLNWGAQCLTGENLKVVSTFKLCSFTPITKKMHDMRTAISKVENSAQVLSRGGFVEHLSPT